MGQDDDTAKIGNATVRWASGLDATGRDDLLRKMQAIRPAKRRPRVNHERARAAAEERGGAALARPDTAEPSERACMVVRIYYRSQGEEILAFDTAPMTSAAASRLHSEYSSPGWVGVDSDIFPVSAPKPLRSDARFVVLPSQRSEPVAESWDAPVAAVLALVPEPTQAAPIPTTRRSYYADAMARRVARRAA